MRWHSAWQPLNHNSWINKAKQPSLYQFFVPLSSSRHCDAIGKPSPTEASLGISALNSRKVNATLNMSFSSQEVIRLEALCKELYESQDAAARAEAEKALVSFQVGSPFNLKKCPVETWGCLPWISFPQNSPESLGKCQRLLDRGNSPYAQLLATTTITKLISR